MKKNDNTQILKSEIRRGSKSQSRKTTTYHDGFTQFICGKRIRNDFFY